MQLRDFLRQRLADALDLLQGARLDPLGDLIFAQSLQETRAGLIGADLERILALQFQQRGDVGKDGGDLGLVHGARER